MGRSTCLAATSRSFEFFSYRVLSTSLGGEDATLVALLNYFMAEQFIRHHVVPSTWLAFTVNICWISIGPDDEQKKEERKNCS